MPRWITLLLLTFLSNCSTPYKDSGFMGGYSETQLQPGLWQVNFRGNGYTSTERAADFTMLRASELCLQDNHTYLAVLDQTSESRAYTVGGNSSRTTFNATTTGNYTRGTASTRTSSPTTFYKPSTGLVIECLDQEFAEAWDAEFLGSSIRQKYDIELTE